MITGGVAAVGASCTERFCGSIDVSRVGEVVVGCVERAGVLRELVGLVRFVGEDVGEE